MNSLNSLYFPGTALYSFRQYPLFLLFSKIHLLGVAEHNIHGREVQATDTFIKAGFCQRHTASPLGDDFERFRHLINDIYNRKDDYASQLSALTIAAMSNPSESGDSQQEIVSSLLKSNLAFPDKRKKQKYLDLWQARLVLAIAEILDREEEDIAQQLAVLKDEEADLFRELQGKDVDPEEENPLKELSLLRKNMNPPIPGNMQKRFSSWKQLYRQGDIPPYDLLLTTNRDAADQILESFDRENEVSIIPPIQLSLPATVSASEDDAMQHIHSYRENNMEMIEEITEELLYLKTCDNLVAHNSQESFLSSFCEPWETSIESHFPAKEFGRIPVSFYCFAGIPCPTLLGTDRQNSIRTNGLLAIADISHAGI